MSQIDQPSQPQVIFFDAVGTLFQVRGSVGQIYSQAAAEFGVTIDPIALDQSFDQAFRKSEPPAFPGADPGEIVELERRWWLDVVERTFGSVVATGTALDPGQAPKQPEWIDYRPQFQNFIEFFNDIYDQFATLQPWQLYPETQTVLQQLHDHGIPLGIISNFDSRLYAVLEALDLKLFFRSVTISTLTGAAKPDPWIFEAALKNYGYPAKATIHVGDSRSQDYQGAKQAGLKAIWLDREGTDPDSPVPATERIPDLTRLLSVFG